MKKTDIIALCSYVSSGGLAVLIEALGAAMPAQAKTIAAIGAIVIALAGVIVHVYGNQNVVAQAIVADAPVVSPGTKDVPPSGAQTSYGTNVSTTSTQPIVAPVAQGD